MGLEGIRILDLTRLLPGPFCSMLLADMGADVVKVEEPGRGDYMRWYPPLRDGQSIAFNAINRNKRSITLNLKSDAGRELFLKLAARADAVLEGNRPGVMDRLGAGWSQLHAVNPKLVLCSITGFGQTGPWAQRAGHDLNYMAIAGALGLNAAAGGDPHPLGVQVADIGAGAMLSALGVVAAIVRARASGAGDHVDVSMTDGAFAILSVHLGAYFATGEPPERGRMPLSGRDPCYNVYRCADGRYVTVGALEPKFWEALCTAVERPELVPTQFEPEALATWRELFATRPRDEWLRVLEPFDACVGPVNDLAEACADPQLRHRGMVVELEHPVLGPTPQVGTPIKLRNAPAGVRTPAPRLGEHTRSELAAAGLSAAEIDALVASGAAAEAEPWSSAQSEPRDRPDGRAAAS